MNLNLMRPFGDKERTFDPYHTLRHRDDIEWSPPSDIEETKTSYLVTTELPGVAKDDVSISICDDVLTICGDKKSDTSDNKRHTYERTFGSFTRSFHLPKSVDIDKIDASFKNGLLKLNIPKIDEPKAKEIEISID